MPLKWKQTEPHIWETEWHTIMRAKLQPLGAVRFLAVLPGEGDEPNAVVICQSLEAAKLACENGVEE